MTSKLDIAGGHIRAAIQMIAIGANPYSTHVIVMACEEMLRSIAEARKAALAGSLDHAVKKDRLDEWRKHIRSAYNFFKHADRDASTDYDGPSEGNLQILNQIQTMLNCASYQGLSGTAPEEMTLFMNLTAFRFHSDVLDDEFFKKFPEAEAMANKLAGMNAADIGFGLRLMLRQKSQLPDG
ncbi:MAG TPA: hypothetical protein VN838_13855 [Bradyrhizobium sp.]|nr:hypothetical protein [Bradyrhizobium sp.]